MREIFVDTNYWLALINPFDQWHEAAIRAKAGIGAARLVTTELVLVEVLNYSCALSADARRTTAGAVRDILQDAQVETVLYTHNDFLSALELYERCPDKGYSLTGCVSMNVMRVRGIAEALTHDHHFAQEVFTILL